MLAKIDNLILDMDGVLWRGETPMPGLVKLFETLRNFNINFILATNNASKMAVQYTKKLAHFGIEVPPAKILTSAETTASYLRTHYAKGTAVYIVGTQGLHDALAAQNFRVVSQSEAEEGVTAEIVVAGYTPDTTYSEMAMGTLLIHRGAAFIGTNPDPSFPSERGPLPGAGAILALMSATTGIQPLTIGKPNPIVFEEAVRRLGVEKSRIAMVGDRLTTDIVGAKAAGLAAIMLLSGISTREDVDRSDVKPDLILNDISDLTRQLAAAHGR